MRNITRASPPFFLYRRLIYAKFFPSTLLLTLNSLPIVFKLPLQYQCLQCTKHRIHYFPSSLHSRGINPTRNPAPHMEDPGAMKGEEDICTRMNVYLNSYKAFHFINFKSIEILWREGDRISKEWDQKFRSQRKCIYCHFH